MSDITVRQLGGKEFHRLTVSPSMGGITAYADQWVTVHNDYLLLLHMTAGSEAGLQELARVADRLRLSPVAAAVDNSVEGAAFRSRITPVLARPEKHPFWKNAILVLAAIGVLFLVLGACARLGRAHRAAHFYLGSKSPLHRCANCGLLSNWRRGRCLYCGSTTFVRYVQGEDWRGSAEIS